MKSFPIEAAADLIVEAFANGGTLYICGNGGSAAQAAHIPHPGAAPHHPAHPMRAHRREVFP